MARLSRVPWLDWKREGLAIAGIALALIVVLALSTSRGRQSTSIQQAPKVQLGGAIVTFYPANTGKSPKPALSIGVGVRLDDGSQQIVSANPAGVGGCRPGDRVTVSGAAVRPGSVRWLKLIPGGCVVR